MIKVLHHNASGSEKIAEDLWSRAALSLLDRRCLGDRISLYWNFILYKSTLWQYSMTCQGFSAQEIKLISKGDRVPGFRGRSPTCQPQPLLHSVQVFPITQLYLNHLWSQKIHEVEYRLENPKKYVRSQILSDIWDTVYNASKKNFSSSQLSCCLRSSNVSCPFLAGPSGSSPSLIRELALHTYRLIFF